MRPTVHLPTIRGRMRADAALLVLVGTVVAVTTALVAAVQPVAERTADRAVAAAVREAGLRGAVVATLPEGYDDPSGTTREPRSDVKIRQDAEYARFALPRRVAAVLAPGVATLVTPELQLLDGGPGRYLRLAYVSTATGPPEVSYEAGGAPRAGVDGSRATEVVPRGAAPWPVEVAVSVPTARALGLEAGDRLPAQDEQHRRFEVRISGVYAASRPREDAWHVVDGLLRPEVGVSEGFSRTAAAALVSSDSLPDLRVALPADDLTERVVFRPRPDALRWRSLPAVRRGVVSLQSAGGAAADSLSWDSLLDHVLGTARADVDAARGQSRVLLVGLVTAALLVLLVAAQLLARRRAGPLAVARERGASLPGLGAELAVEATVVAAVGAGAGLLATRLLAGGPGATAWWPVVIGAVLAPPALGVLSAARATGGRRVPANRTARRAARRSVGSLRLALEAAVVATAVLSFVALRQRGVDAGDLTAVSAPTWWALASGLVILRLLPVVVRLVLRRARRSTGTVVLVSAARLAMGPSGALAVLVTAVAVAQLVFGTAVATTEHRDQAAGALAEVGGDVRLRTDPATVVDALAARVAHAPGVRAAVAARVADGVAASSTRAAGQVRLVVVDAAGYARLLRRSDLPDAGGLGGLSGLRDGRVPALLSGGDPRLRDGLRLAWQGTDVALDVVGTAPRVEASADPVVLVDSRTFAQAGAPTPPDTVWAVGRGAVAAVRRAAGPDDDVTGYADVLAARRHAPLAAALVGLAAASAVLLALLAGLGTVLAAAAEAPERRRALGRLRSLGIRDRDLRRVLAGELLVPVVAAAVTGALVGALSTVAMAGSLSLGRITGRAGPPDAHVPWWSLLVVPALAAVVLVVARREWRALRRTPLATLLRS